MLKKILSIILLISTVLAFTSCGDSVEYKYAEYFKNEGNETDMTDFNTTNPVVAMKIKDYGTIVVELYPEYAPNTVNSFISLVKKGFYDNNTIHRCQADFVLQGGDPKGNGTGGPGYSIKGEFTDNGFTNELKHEEGVISMARGGNDFNSAGSQFFIVLKTSASVTMSLDGKYSAFGKVISGMDVAKAIEANEKTSGSMGTLVNVLTIEKTVVDTKGKTYPEPEKIN